jgi:hypothetical protein
LLRHTNHSVDVVYYEVLDLPLPALEQLKTLRVREDSRAAQGLG